MPWRPSSSRPGVMSSSQNRDELAQRRSLLESQLNGVLVAGASQRAPQVIDPAVPPTVADPKHRASAGALGALLGLLIGICVAALLESFRPTLAGSDAIADALGVPMLGRCRPTLKGDPRRSDDPRSRFGSPRRRCARRPSNSYRSEGRSTFPPSQTRWTNSTSRRLALSSANGKNNGRMSVHRFGVDPESRMRSTGTNGKADSALVAVVPSTIKRSDLRELGDIQALTSWPLVGVVTHDRPKRKIRRRAEPALQPRSADEGKVDLSQHAG